MRQRGQAGRPTAGPIGPDVNDAELAVRAAAGDIAAFEELYCRHSQAAWRVAQAVTGNSHDAADAVSDAFTRVFQALPTRLQGGDNFRPYLLASVRNAAIDVLRRAGRTTPSDNEDVLDTPTVGREPSDLVLAEVDSDMVAAAFRTLPERWRTVLWLTEVENMPPREVAVLLGISANGVAQLAVRARAGLRERFLQAHLRKGEVRRECRATVANLGAYAAGGLAPRDISKVDQHLAGCQACRDRVKELEDLSQTLHRSIPPLPVFLAAAVTGKWAAVSGAGQLGPAAAGVAGAKIGAGAGAVKSAGAGVGAMAMKAGAGAAAAGGAFGGTASVAVASVALLAAGLLGVRAVDPPVHVKTNAPGTAGAEQAAAPPAVELPVPEALLDYPVAGVEVPTADDSTVVSAASDTARSAGDLDAGSPADDARKAIADVEPAARLGIWLPGPLAVALGLGDSTRTCPVVGAGNAEAGCGSADPPHGPDRDGLGLGTGGTALPDTTTTVAPPAGAPMPTPPIGGRSTLPPLKP